MSDGTSWYSWLSFPFFAPLSGSVSQDIAPVPYQGVPEIEKAVIGEAASFGSQLGTLADAVVELARHVEARGGAALLGATAAEAPDTALGRLQALREEVEAIKGRHKDAARRDFERARDRLKAVDPDGYAALVSKAP